MIPEKVFSLRPIFIKYVNIKGKNDDINSGKTDTNHNKNQTLIQMILYNGG
jgi:hypothetical protein